MVKTKQRVESAYFAAVGKIIAREVWKTIGDGDGVDDEEGPNEVLLRSILDNIQVCNWRLVVTI